MSDSYQISNDPANTNEHEETFLIIDDFKSIAISDPNSSILENDAQLSDSNELANTVDSKQTTEDENDSEYEDVEEDDLPDVPVITLIRNKSPLKTIIDEDDVHINIKPRRMNKKHQDDEHSEGDENDDDNQNVPKTNRDTQQLTKIKVSLDDDNNIESPAYIPRKGKFYEHDDRTLSENDRAKQELSRNESRFYTDSDAKWQHDLYFHDEQLSKSRYPTSRWNHDRFEYRNDYPRGQLHLNDYISRSQRDRNDYHQQLYHNDYRRRVPQETHSVRTNNFEIEDYDRSLSSHHHGFNRDCNLQKETRAAPRQQRGDYNPYPIDERTFHRRRNFTNSQFHQHVNGSKSSDYLSNRNDQKQSKENNSFRDNRHYGGLRKYELSENQNSLPPRLRINNNERNSTQRQEYQENSVLNPSINGSNMERSKRYSNMRNNLTNPSQQQGTSSIQIKHYHSNKPEQNDWPQAPPLLTSYLPTQIITPQIFYQQQTSRYVPINYSQTSVSNQFQANK